MSLWSHTHIFITIIIINIIIIIIIIIIILVFLYSCFRKFLCHIYHNPMKIGWLVPENKQLKVLQNNRKNQGMFSF